MNPANVRVTTSMAKGTGDGYADNLFKEDKAWESAPRSEEEVPSLSLALVSVTRPTITAFSLEVSGAQEVQVSVGEGAHVNTEVSAKEWTALSNTL